MRLLLKPDYEVSVELSDTETPLLASAHKTHDSELLRREKSANHFCEVKLCECIAGEHHKGARETLTHLRKRARVAPSLIFHYDYREFRALDCCAEWDG